MLRFLVIWGTLAAALLFRRFELGASFFLFELAVNFLLFGAIIGVRNCGLGFKGFRISGFGGFRSSGFLGFSVQEGLRVRV